MQEDKLWKTWERLQDNGVISYNAAPEKNLGVGKRDDFLNFSKFCVFHGNVLDVGVGPQKCPTHIAYNTDPNVFFVGVDPLKGEHPKCFPFVQALGEYLPFKDGTFDQVLFVTTLDHFVDPVIALVEAKRVLKNKGEICIWIGEKSKDAPKPAVSPDWYKNLVVPENAEDPFHFKRFNIEEFKGYLQKAGLVIINEEVIVVDEWRKNCFYKVSKQS